MNLKKRYWFLIIFFLLYFICQSSFFDFRTSNAEIKKLVLAAGQQEPTFFDYEINGRNMHAVHVGSDSLPLVILLHGAPGSSDNMLEYFKDKKLTAIAQLVAVDRPGYGLSDYGKAEGSVKKQAAAIKPIIEKYISDKNKKVILAGHSFGGPVVARMAMDFPELIDGILILAGSIAPELEPKKWFQKPLDLFFIRWFLPPATKVCNQEIIPLPEELEKMLPLWENINCPVNLIHGTKDNLVPVENVLFAKKMLINSPEILIDTLPEQNHFILWSHKELIVKRIIEMINK